MADTARDTIILGATGFVAGELLRLLAGHPRLRVVAPVSRSAAGRPVEEVFPHLAGIYPGLSFVAPQDLGERLAGRGPVAIFGCAPHGESASALAALIACVEGLGRQPLVVDLSADFRHATADIYRAVYGTEHGAPELLSRFTCALPDLERRAVKGPIAHPGCFTTAVTLGATPLIAQGLVGPQVRVSAVTGSTGSGRTPGEGTHHPRRHANLWSYNTLRHRHQPEMEALLTRRAGQAVNVAFAPHSGPFARGIHATLFMTLREPVPADELAALMNAHYEDTPFVEASVAAPDLKDVIGTNRCRLGVASDGREVVVLSVIDNRVKGAAGGALQWMNRLAGFPETEGLLLPALPWA